MTLKAPTNHASKNSKTDYKFFSSVVIVGLFRLIFWSEWFHIEFRPGFLAILTKKQTINARSCVRIQLSSFGLRGANHILLVKLRD